MGGHLDLVDPKEPEACTAGAPAELAPSLLDQTDRCVGDPARPALRVPRDETGLSGSLRAVPPLAHGLAVETEPLGGRLETVSRGVLENGHSALNLPPMLPADLLWLRHCCPPFWVGFHPTPSGVPFLREYFTERRGQRGDRARNGVADRLGAMPGERGP